MLDNISTALMILLAVVAILAGLWFGQVLGESAAARDKPGKDGRPAPRRSFGAALQNAATTSALRLWKWQRARKKREEQDPR